MGFRPALKRPFSARTTRRSFVFGAASGAAAATMLAVPDAALADSTLTPTAVQTSDYSAAVNDFVPVDASSGSVKVTLPTAPADQSQVGVRTVAFAADNSVTVACGGSDILNDPELHATSLRLSAVDESVLLQYQASTSTWYALSGGPSLPGVAPAAGLSSRTLVEAGSIVVINEALNALDAGYLVQGSVADQSEQMQDFLTAIGQALGGNGGRGIIPSGTYHMGGTSLKYPSSPCVVEGETPIGFYGWSPSGGTELVWDSDVSGPPHATYGLTLGMSGQPQALRNIHLSGPQSFPGGNGALPSAMGGINCGQSSRLDAVSIAVFSTGVGFGGNGKSYDHTVGDYVLVENCGFAFNLLPNSGGSGDFHFTRLRIEGFLAAIGVAQSGSSGLASSTFFGCGLYGPFAFYRYADGSGAPYDFLDSTGLYGVSTETVGHSVAYDELWQTSQGSKIQGCMFTSGASSAAPNPGYATWKKDFSVTGVSGSQITVSEGTGFVFRPGMTVTGSGSADGTTVTSIAGDWPWASATLTLSSAPSGSPSSCTISQPFIAALVAQVVTGNQFFGWFSYASYPMICAKGATNNHHHDGYNAYQVATQHQLIADASGGGFGNFYGSHEAGPCLGSSLAFVDFEQGDLVMCHPEWAGVVRCDGSRKPIGAAIRAVSANSGCVDYVIRAHSSWVGPADIVVNNRGAGTIPAGSLIKIDTANPGGVTVATSLADGPAIGITAGSDIPGGSAGNASEVWF